MAQEKALPNLRLKMNNNDILHVPGENEQVEAVLKHVTLSKYIARCRATACDRNVLFEKVEITLKTQTEKRKKKRTQQS